MTNNTFTISTHNGNQNVVDLNHNFSKEKRDKEEHINKEKPIQILVRPVQIMKIKPKDVSIRFNTSDEMIDVVS